MSRILIVDDDPAVGRLIGTLLKFEGHDSCQATDLYEGMQMLRVWQPEVVLLDLSLGRQDGRELYAKAREDGIEVPFIVVSAYGARRASEEMGCDGWLDKPFEIDTLLAKVQEVTPTIENGSRPSD
jgi:two-component system KDP operon response regulator KdpE